MIISGAGEGAERGAQRAAIDLDLSYGGWYLAADEVPEIYRVRMREAPSRAMQRRLNVQDSDATLFIVLDKEMKFSVDACKAMRRPAKTLQLGSSGKVSPTNAAALRAWLGKRKVSVLNVVGDEGEQLVRDALVQVLGQWSTAQEQRAAAKPTDGGGRTFE